MFRSLVIRVFFETSDRVRPANDLGLSNARMVYLPQRATDFRDANRTCERLANDPIKGQTVECQQPDTGWEKSEK